MLESLGWVGLSCVLLGACRIPLARGPVPEPVVVAWGKASPVTTTGPMVPTTDIETEVVRLTNDYRQQQGQPALTIPSALMTFARSRSQDMATQQYFSHTTPDGLSVFDLLRKAGVPFAAARENIAWNKGYSGSQVAQQAMEGWIASSGHQANMVAPDVTKLGVGVVQAADGAWYLTQVFTN